MNVVWLLVCFSVFGPSSSQCYEDSDLSLYQTEYPSVQYQEAGGQQCIPDYSVICENIIDDNAGKGITCSRKGSTAVGTWTDTNGTEVVCDDFNNTYRWVHCTRPQPGSITLFTDELLGWMTSKHNYTCCIDGLCATVRILFTGDLIYHTYPDSISSTAQLETCIIVPPFDITAIPQQYLVQMNTSVIPFSRLSSFINCTDGDGITCGQSYYTLIDLNEERYQMTVPVTWSTNSTTNTDHYYSCRVRYGSENQYGKYGFFIDSKNKYTLIKASSAPSSVSYEVVNATAINVSWSISGDFNGFIINITSDGLDTVTMQLTDGSLREYVINEIISERNYTVEIRGYYELLGPAEATTVRLEASISSVDSSLLSVSDDLSTQVIQVNCTTFGFTPDQLSAWMIDSVLITPDSSYEPVNGSVLQDSTYQTYRHYITLTGSFTDGTTISCNANGNGESISKHYTLRAPSSPPTGLSAAILSSTSLSISWTPLSDVNGYIIQYTGGQPVMFTGEDSSNSVLEGLTQGTTYQINVYSYSNLLSTTSTTISVLLDVPILTSFDAESLNSTSVQLTWSLSDSSIIDNYTLSVTRVCDNMVFPMITYDGNMIMATYSGLSSGFKYSLALSLANTLGMGMERTDTVTTQESIPPSVSPLLKEVIVISSTAVRLTWDEINCSYSNGIITGYRVMYHNEVQQSTTINITDDTTSIVITGLMEFQLYYISVSAINSIGAGPYSEEKKIYTPDHSHTVKNINCVLSISFGQLSWKPLPSVTNVSYEYEVASAVIDSAECTGNSVSLPNEYTVYSLRTSNSTIEVLGLMSGTCYVFGVRAYVITSESTSTGEFTVINGVTVYNAIDNFNAQWFISVVSLSWNTLPVVSIDEYFYEVGYITSNDDECTAAGLTTLPQHYTSYINTTNGSIEVTGLRDDTCYVFGVRVYSTRTGQHGQWSVMINKTLTAVLTHRNITTAHHPITVRITLSWPPLMTSTDDSFVYEVAYIARSEDTQCSTSSSNIDTLPDGYTLFGNTTDNSITVTGLQPGTCYAFGIRVYISGNTGPGEWTLILQKTNGAGLDSTSAVSSGSSTGIVVGLVIACIVILILLILLAVSVLIILWMWRSHQTRKSKEETSTKLKLNIPTDDVLYDIPGPFPEGGSSTIEMHQCEPYQLHKSDDKPLKEQMVDETHIYN